MEYEQQIEQERDRELDEMKRMDEALAPSEGFNQI